MYRTKSLPPLLRALVPTIALTLTLGASSEAEARRGGLVLINTGEDVMSIAPIPADTLRELELDPALGTPEAGVMYSRFGVFWLDIVRWNPQYVIYVDDGMDGFSYDTASASELAALTGLSEAEIKKPALYYLPPGGVILGLLILIGAPLYGFSVAAGNKRRTTLMADPRYQAAVAQYQGDFETPEDARLEAAVAGLASQGVPAEEARDNLVFLCAIDTDE